jgi:hypothetical protein
MTNQCVWALDPDGPGQWWFTSCGEQFLGAIAPEADRYNLPKLFAFCPYCAQPLVPDRSEHAAAMAKHLAAQQKALNTEPSPYWTCGTCGEKAPVESGISSWSCTRGHFNAVEPNALDAPDGNHGLSEARQGGSVEPRAVEPAREHPTTDPATAYRTTCNHPPEARGLTGCLLCGAIL